VTDQRRQHPEQEVKGAGGDDDTATRLKRRWIMLAGIFGGQEAAFEAIDQRRPEAARLPALPSIPE
jgi:hypothetical protein